MRPHVPAVPALGPGDQRPHRPPGRCWDGAEHPIQLPSLAAAQNSDGEEL